MAIWFVRYGYVPLMLLGINGVAIALAHRPWAPLWMVVLILVAIGLSFLAERVAPYSPEWNESMGDARRDAAHAFVNETALLLTVLVVPAVALLSPFHTWWPSSIPFVLQVLIAAAVADFGITLMHYASHKVPALWRLHAVHHSIKRFYGFNGLMKHPVHGGLELMAGTAPLLIMGLPQAVAEALTVLIAVQLLLQHSNADYRIGRLRWCWRSMRGTGSITSSGRASATSTSGCSRWSGTICCGRSHLTRRGAFTATTWAWRPSRTIRPDTPRSSPSRSGPAVRATSTVCNPR